MKGQTPPQIQSNTITVIIPKPDGVRISAGTNVNKQPGQFNPTSFVIQSGGIDSCTVNGTAQERVSNWVYNVNGVNQTLLVKGDWVPNSKSTAVEMSRFLIYNGNTIVDKRSEVGSRLPEPNPNMAISVSTSTQELRVILKDLCANSVYATLGTFNVEEFLNPDGTFYFTVTSK